MKAARPVTNDEREKAGRRIFIASAIPVALGMFAFAYPDLRNLRLSVIMRNLQLSLSPSCNGVMTDATYATWQSAVSDLREIEDAWQEDLRRRSGGNPRVADLLAEQGLASYEDRRSGPLNRIERAGQAETKCRGDGKGIWQWKEPLSGKIYNYCNACRRVYARQFPDREFTRR